MSKKSLDVTCGEIKKGERIPRKPLPEFSEAGNLSAAISRDGLFGSALDDKNEYGPHAMIILLMIVASITGSIILAEILVNVSKH